MHVTPSGGYGPRFGTIVSGGLGPSIASFVYGVKSFVVSASLPLRNVISSFNRKG